MMPGDPAEPRELLGRLVRQTWVAWAREQPDPKPSWLLPWDELDDGQKEADMRIGTALFEAGRAAGWSGDVMPGLGNQVTDETREYDHAPYHPAPGAG